MENLWIILVNLIYIPAIWYGVVNDDATTLKLRPYPVKKTKITSILLHMTTALYIYNAFGCTKWSLIAAILFSIHPLTVQVSCWMSGNMYGLNALLFLYILYIVPDQEFPWAGGLYLFSNLSAASNLFTPLLYIFTKYWLVALIFPVMALLSIKGLRANIKGKKEGDGLFTPALPPDFDLNKFSPKKLILVIKTFGYYALACLLPMKNGLYNSFMVTLGASKKETRYWYSLNRHFWGGLFAIILMATIWWFNKFNFIGMGIMLFVLSIGPFLNFITIQQLTAPRYAYLPLVGFQVALVQLVFMLPREMCWAILGGLFLFYLDRTLRVMKHYKKDNLSMILLESEIFPENPRLWYYRCQHMLHKNNPVMAWAEASMGLKYLPEDCQLWFGLSVASFELGDMNAATEFLKTSERFMLQTDRESMKAVIDEMKIRIQLSLQGKWKNPTNRIIGR